MLPTANHFSRHPVTQHPYNAINFKNAGNMANENTGPSGVIDIMHESGISPETANKWRCELDAKLVIGQPGASFTQVRCDTSLWMFKAILYQIAWKTNKMPESEGFQVMCVLPDETSASTSNAF